MEGLSLVVWSLVLGDIGPECERPIEGIVGCVSSGLVSLHMKGTFLGESFIISRNWLALGGAVSPRSKMSKH